MVAIQSVLEAIVVNPDSEFNVVKYYSSQRLIDVVLDPNDWPKAVQQVHKEHLTHGYHVTQSWVSLYSDHRLLETNVPPLNV